MGATSTNLVPPPTLRNDSLSILWEMVTLPIRVVLALRFSPTLPALFSHRYIPQVSLFVPTDTLDRMFMVVRWHPKF